MAGGRSFGDDTRRLIGSPTQLVRVDRAQLTEGPAAGAGVLNVRNPGGISFEVLLDSAMDIGWADARGVPLAWASPRGRVATTRYDPSPLGWVRSFGGGLLTTCGLASTGAPSEEGGRIHPLHGRIGSIPAENVVWTVGEGDAGPEVVIRGTVLEAALGEATLRLDRTIRARCDAAELVIEDVVANDGFDDAEHMFRHHLNLGHPIVHSSSRIVTDAEAYATRGGGDVVPIADTDLRVAGGRVEELVTYARSGPHGNFRLESPTAGVALELDWSVDTFPIFVVWRDASAGVNVLGVEPSMSGDDGRQAARRDGEIVFLDPGESRAYRTRVAIVPL